MHITQWSHNQIFLSPAGTGDYNAVLSRPLNRLDTLIVNHALEITADELKEGKTYSTYFWGSDSANTNNQEKPQHNQQIRGV